MKTYYWGRLYVSLSKILAILILLLGIVLLGFGSFYYIHTVETLIYKPSAKLNEKIRRTNDAYQDALSQLRELESGRISEKFTTSLSEEVLGATYEDSSSLQLLEVELKNLKAKIQEFKISLTTPLISESSQILGLLDKKAGLGMAPIVSRPSRGSYSQLLDLYEDSNSEKLRIFAISELQNFLNVLAGSAEDPANKATLEKTLLETAYLESVIRLGFRQDVIEPVQNTLAQPQNSENAAAKAGKRMRTLLKMTQSAVTDEWSVDRELHETEELLGEEQTKCREAEQSVFQFRISSGAVAFLLLVTTLATCFALLVISDVIAAALDAGYGGLVSSKYFNSLSDETDSKGDSKGSTLDS